jgi:hypothetical protein
MNYLKLYKSDQQPKEIKFLTETCKYFVNDYLSNQIIKEFLGDKVPNEESVIKSIKNICIFEENRVFIPYNEVRNIINFSIFTEREEVLIQILENKFGNKFKLSNILESGISDDTYKNIEELYESDEVLNFILEKSQSVSDDVFEKNDFVVVSFN